MTINRVFEYMNSYTGFVQMSGNLDKLSMVIKNNHHAFEITELPKGYRIKLWDILGESIDLCCEHKHDTKAGFKKFKLSVVEKLVEAGSLSHSLKMRDIDCTYESKGWENSEK